MTKRLTVDMTDELHRQFKTYCAMQGELMNPRIIELIMKDMDDECPNKICSYPLSRHDYSAPTETSPGEYSCPTLDEDELPY